MPGSSCSAFPSRAVSICGTGADQGPRELRLASDSIETYSPALDRDLEDLAMADLGDCELGDGTPREQLTGARREVEAFWHPGLRPVMLGGDHTATVPVIEVLAPAIPDLRVLQLDAHPDLREEFLGERYNYASAMARVMDAVAPERVYQVGMRTGAREEYRRRRRTSTRRTPSIRWRRCGAWCRPWPPTRSTSRWTSTCSTRRRRRAPARPSRAALRAAELVEIVRLLEPCRIVGTDLVEVAHAWDPSARTGITASWILREALLTWWGK